MIKTNFADIYKQIESLKKSITNEGWRVGEALLGEAWTKTLEPFWTPIDTGLMVSSTLIIREREGGGFVVWLINEAKDPDTGTFYPRRVEFGIGQRPQPWFFPAVIFAVATAEPEMVMAANRVIILALRS